MHRTSNNFNNNHGNNIRAVGVLAVTGKVVAVVLISGVAAVVVGVVVKRKQS